MRDFHHVSPKNWINSGSRQAYYEEVSLELIFPGNDQERAVGDTIGKAKCFSVLMI